MKICGILTLENINLFSIRHKTWRTRQEAWRERLTLSNQGAQSRASLIIKDRQIAEETDSFINLSQACSAWDFFSEFRKMPRIKCVSVKFVSVEGEHMFRIPRSSRFVVYENEKKPFDMCQMDKDMSKLIFTRVFVVSKHPFIARIVRVEKEVITK